MTAQPAQPSSKPATRTMKVVFDDPEFDGQLLRALAYTYEKGADLNDCYSTARRITEGDHESWYAEWTQTADRVAAAADVSRAAGHPVSAREGYLRASNYYRTSSIFMYRLPLDPRMVLAYQRQQDTFREAAALFDPPIEAVAIPFEGTTLPGYLCRVDHSETPRPTLIATGGYDGTAEETYFAGVAAIVRRGYHCLTFDGPGQGGALLEQNLHMRPDWENVVRPVVDYALTRREIDPNRIALMGRSWGGYLAPRAATGEHRLAACIADPGLYDLDSGRQAMFPPELVALIREGDAAKLTPVFDEIMQNPAVAFTFNRGMLVHGLATPWAVVTEMVAYKVAGIAEQISCPTLICQAENDTRASQSGQLYAALTCPKTLLEFTDAEGAGEHCEAGASALFDQRVFDWLDDVMAARG